MRSNRAVLLLLVVVVIAGCNTPLTPRQVSEKQRIIALLNDPGLAERMAKQARAELPQGPEFLDSRRMAGVKLKRPVARSRPAPVYSYEVRKARMQGLVWVAFIVEPTGDVSHVQCIASDQPAFADATVRAVSQWKFRPATADGKPVPVRLLVPIAFTLD